MIKAASLATEINLLRFSQFLQSQGILHRINEESGQQIIWVQEPSQAIFIREALDTWRFDDPVPGDRKLATQILLSTGRGIMKLGEAFMRAPVSLLLITACLIVAIVSELGTQPQRVSFLFYPALDHSGLTALLISINEITELLRSFAPMLLHFGELHLVFNMLWLWYFGRQLESTHPRWLYIALILICSFAGNTAQYLFTGYNNFGGMSGVVYGLVGYVWLIHIFMPKSGLLINSKMFLVFVVALVAMEILASSWIASAAHIGGLIAGLLFAALVVFFYRQVLGKRVIEK